MTICKCRAENDNLEGNVASVTFSRVKSVSTSDYTASINKNRNENSSDFKFLKQAS